MLIKINKEFVVHVDSKPIRGIGPRRALLALAALADDKATEFHLRSTAGFVGLTHPKSENIPRDWNRDKNDLQNKPVMVVVELVTQNEYDLSGFQIEFAPEIDSAKIKERLAELAPKARRKPPL